MSNPNATTRRHIPIPGRVPEVLVTHQPLDLEAVARSVEREEAGAVVTFFGTTRDHHGGKQVLRLEYEAQEKLAHKAMEKLVHDAIKRFGLAAATMHHRLGSLEIGETSVAIAVSAPHRAAAFDGCRWLIDTLKTGVPIFKKEHYADGSPPVWVGPDGKPVKA
ncbi:MAG: molybdenum cofactor biosynthesis protein MoaE [Planctomycetota bacterium]|nr:molybdenum cofactor biosynthesis protein MoaE [Planctomycetota bacterium]